MLNYMQQLKEIAAVDPRLAVSLALAQPQLPQVRTLRHTFESGAPEQPGTVQFDEPITEDFWVYDISYQVQQPQAFTGSLLRGQQVWYNSLNPDIVASFTVTGGVGLPWLFAPSPTPIEMLARPATGPGGEGRYGCCSNFVMFFPQTVKATFWLTRQYDDTVDGTGEIPTIITVAFAGLTLGCKNYGGLTVKQAQSILKSEYDIQTPDIGARQQQRGLAMAGQGRREDPRVAGRDARDAAIRGELDREVRSEIEHAGSELFEGWRGTACANPTDSRDNERDRSTIDQGSASFDPVNQGIGASPYGSAVSSRVFIPTDPTNGREPRVLLRLAAISVETGDAIRISGLRQAVTIGCLLDAGRQNPAQAELEMDQVSPFWRFTDGNICWGLRQIPGPGSSPRTGRVINAGTGIDYASGTESVRLLDPAGISAAPAGGFFPGLPIGNLGEFYDIRFPWNAQSAMGSMDIELVGPVIVAFYASVRQTNPLTRQTLSSLLPANFVPPQPEDKFVVDVERSTNPTLPPVIFRYAAGSIIAEIGPQRRLPGRNAVQGRTPHS